MAVESFATRDINSVLAKIPSGDMSGLIEEFLTNGEGFGFEERLARVYVRYQDELKRCNALDYDDLIIATGARVRKLDLPGSDLPGVHYLRTIHDVTRMQGYMREGGRLVTALVGAGIRHRVHIPDGDLNGVQRHAAVLVGYHQIGEV